MSGDGDGGRIVILGGGPAGLGAGWKLAERGYKITILEAEDQVGGQSRTVRRGDWRFDLGGHRFFTKYPDVQREVEQLIGDDKLMTTRRSVIHLNNQWIQYPLELADLLSRMSPLITIKAGIDYLWATARCRVLGYDDTSFESWVVNRFGRELYRVYFSVYTEKLWGMPPSQISADWAAQRISLIDLWDVFVRMFGFGNDTPRTYLTDFIYPKRGIGTISDEMAQRFRAAGGEIQLNCSVEELVVDRGRITSVCVSSKDGRRDQIPCDHVISTIPLPVLVRALGLRGVADELRLAQGLRFRSLRFLNLALDLPSISSNTWIYVPERRYLFFRVQEPRNWSPYLAPEGKTSMILELACGRGDPLWHDPDDVVLSRCLPQLVELGLLEPEQTDAVLDCFSTYLTHAYPVYDLDYRRRVEAALKLCDKVTNLVTLGRQGLFRYNNMDQSLKMAFLAAQHWGDPDLDRRVRAVANDQHGFEDGLAQAADLVESERREAP